MKRPVVTVDVRADLRAGRQPCGRILAAVEQLQPGQCLRLLAPFEPVPLYSLLGARGLTHETRELANGDFEVLFWPTGSDTSALPAAVVPASDVPETAYGGSASSPELRLDVRGLEPPQPMMRVLETIALLQPGQTLVVQTDRRPLHLYPLLESRGFQARTHPLPDGSFETRIHRP